MTEPTSEGAPTRLKRSPLHDRHEALGAKFAEFGGWLMPLEYAGAGVVKEHTAVREAVGVFDVSHLGKISVTGPGAADYVNTVLTNDLRRIEPGQAQYTLCCDDATGGIMDDLIAYLRADDDVFLIPNAANAGGRSPDGCASRHPTGIEVSDRHDEFAVLAVQGTRSDEVLERLGLPVAHDYMSFATAEHAGVELTVCRTGYTGERGYELVVPERAPPVSLWDALLEAGARRRHPAGRARCPRHPAHRDGLPTARAGHHPAGHPARGSPRVGGRAGTSRPSAGVTCCSPSGPRARCGCCAASSRPGAPSPGPACG